MQKSLTNLLLLGGAVILSMAPVLIHQGKEFKATDSINITAIEVIMVAIEIIFHKTLALLKYIMEAKSPVNAIKEYKLGLPAPSPQPASDMIALWPSCVSGFRINAINNAKLSNKVTSITIGIISLATFLFTPHKR